MKFLGAFTKAGAKTAAKGTAKSVSKRAGNAAQAAAKRASKAGKSVSSSVAKGAAKVSTKSKLAAAGGVGVVAILGANYMYASRKKKACLKKCADPMNGPGTNKSPVCEPDLSENECADHCDEKCSKLNRSIVDLVGGGIAGIFSGGSQRVMLILIIVALILVIK